MNPGDIISYRSMCEAEQVQTLQRGMNFRLHPQYSVILMSTKSNAPYDDEVLEDGNILIYEGHDIPKTKDISDPKTEDQPMHNKNHSLTQNGLFFEAAISHKDNNLPAEIVRVYEKIKPGIWVYNGEFQLIDAWTQISNERKVFKFKLVTLKEKKSKSNISDIEPHLEHTRMIPSSIKLKVWQRDNGQCVKCGSTVNLHFDHVIPFSCGGTSLHVDNIQILCMACNLSKSNNIE